MPLTYDLTELMAAGEQVSAPPLAVELYREAFRDYKSMCLWQQRLLDSPSIATAVATAGLLRREGNMDARRLALRIENDC
jgi:hypothetical protein